jgi:hypothetical protein
LSAGTAREVPQAEPLGWPDSPGTIAKMWSKLNSLSYRKM